MKNIFIFISTLFLFMGCGGSGGSGSSSDVVMEVSKLYTVKKGDKVIKSDQNITTIIKIHHAGDKKESVIELIEGNATIIH